MRIRFEFEGKVYEVMVLPYDLYRPILLPDGRVIGVGRWREDFFPPQPRNLYVINSVKATEVK